MYYIRHVVTIMWPTSDLQPFTNLLLWPHGIVKCLLTAHFQMRAEAVSHPGNFHLLFFEYYEFLQTTLLVYCFSRIILQGSIWFRMQRFRFFLFGDHLICYAYFWNFRNFKLSRPFTFTISSHFTQYIKGKKYNNNIFKIISRYMNYS